MSTNARWARKTLLSFTFSTLILSSSVIGVLSLFLLPNLAQSQASASLPPSFFEVSNEESCALLPTAGGTPTWNENTDTCTIPVGSTLNATTPDTALSITTGVTLKNQGTINNGGGSGNEPQPIDVVFSIDSSGSMAGNDPNNLRLSGAIEFVNKLTPGVDQAAVVSWDGDDDDDVVGPTDADWFQSLTFNLNQVKHGSTVSPPKSSCNQPTSPPAQTPQTTCGIDDVDNLGGTPGPGTNLEAGLYKAIEVLDANTRVEPSNKIIVFLTDGKVEGGYDYQRSFEGGPAADARARGYTVYAIGLGTDLDLGILSDIASSTGGGLYITPTAANLDTIYADIHTKSSNGGGSSNDPLPIDIVFSIDSSGSMQSNDPSDLRQNGAAEFVNKLTPGVDQAAVVSWDGDDDDDCVYLYNCPAGSYTDSDFFQDLTYNLNQVKYGTSPPNTTCNKAASPPVQTAQTLCGIDDVDNISPIAPGTGTNLETGLYKAIEVLNANSRVEPSNKIIIFLTDGKVEGGWDYQRSYHGGPAAEAQSRGYRIYAIGLGWDLDLGILGDMANATNGGLYISPTATNLDAIYADIYEKSSANGVEDNIFRIYNNGTLVNGGVINAVLLENGMGAVLNNSVNGSLLMKGPVVNRGTINNNGLWLNDVPDAEPENFGVLNNYGILWTSSDGMLNRPAGLINNYGGGLIDNLRPTQFVNSGTINNYAGAVLHTGQGSLRNGVAPNFGTAVVNNYGSIVNDGLYEIVGGYQFGALFNSAVINQFCGASITGMGVVIGNSPVNACFPIGTIAEATTDSTGQSVNAGVRTFYGQKFGTGATVLSSMVDCAAVKIRKFGSPTGMAVIGFYDANMNLVKSFGTKDVTTLTTSYIAYEFCLPSSDSGHLIQIGQILAVKYTGGDSLNRIEVRRSNIGSGPDYDGLASYHVNFDSSWHSYNTAGNSRDLLFKLTNS